MAFSQTSEEIHLRDNHFLTATAWTDGNAAQMTTTLNLDAFISNDNGHFKIGHGCGAFSQSAKNVRLEGTSLVAELAEISGAWSTDSLDLDVYICNRHGILQYVCGDGLAFAGTIVEVKAPQPKPQPQAEPVPVPMSITIPEPILEPVPAPIPAPVTILEPVPEPVPAPIPAPVTILEPVPEPVPAPVTILEPVPEPVPAPVPETVAVPALGGFAQHAINFYLYNVYLLTATVWAETHESPLTSVLDLNTFLGNDDGHFCVGASAYTSTTRHAHLDGTILVAELQKKDGSWVTDRTDLNQYVSNNNGILEYVGSDGAVKAGKLHQNPAGTHGFALTSDDSYLRNDQFLVATSWTEGKVKQLTSALDLNSFIANDDGHFAVGPGCSGYIGSARSIRLDDTLLICELQKKDGKWVTDSFDLDEYIANHNGILEYICSDGSVYEATLVEHPLGHGGFRQTSVSFQLENDHFLTATAWTDGNASQLTTTLDLNAFIADHDGYFRFGPGCGGYARSARDVRLQGTLLVAELERKDGSWVTDKVDLNLHISNNNGYLEYIRSDGVKYTAVLVPSNPPAVVVPVPPLVVEPEILIPQQAMLIKSKPVVVRRISSPVPEPIPEPAREVPILDIPPPVSRPESVGDATCVESVAPKLPESPCPESTTPSTVQSPATITLDFGKLLGALQIASSAAGASQTAETGKGQNPTLFQAQTTTQQSSVQTGNFGSPLITIIAVFGQVAVA